MKYNRQKENISDRFYFFLHFSTCETFLNYEFFTIKGENLEFNIVFSRARFFLPFLLTLHYIGKRESCWLKNLSLSDIRQTSARVTVTHLMALHTKVIVNSTNKNKLGILIIYINFVFLNLYFSLSANLHNVVQSIKEN